MNIFRLAMRYFRWYHVVILLFGVTAVIGIIWWLRDHERANHLGWDDTTDLEKPEI
ncbi:MAG: hypothetical protein U9N55_08705 [candidate division Zixibacteria bacterium]|nr:hypothetical protein [candidate division Zixibacteria bacterium]